MPWWDHIRAQAEIGKWVSAAVSKTINMPNHVKPSDVKKAYILAYKTGCKGITIYRDGSKSQQVIYLPDSNGNNHEGIEIENDTKKIMNSFGIDAEGILWAATYDSLVYKFDPVTEKFKYVCKLPGFPGNIFFDNDHNIWMSGNGFYQYHYSNDKFFLLTDDPFDNNGIWTPNVIYEDHEWYLLTISHNQDYINSITRYRIEGGEIVEQEDFSERPIFSNKTTGDIRQDQQGNLWGTFKTDNKVQVMNLNQQPFAFALEQLEKGGGATRTSPSADCS